MGGRATRKQAASDARPALGVPKPPPTPANMTHTPCLQHPHVPRWPGAAGHLKVMVPCPHLECHPPLPTPISFLSSPRGTDEREGYTCSPLPRRPQPVGVASVSGLIGETCYTGLHVTVCLTCPLSWGAASLGPPGTDGKHPNERGLHLQGQPAPSPSVTRSWGRGPSVARLASFKRN